MLLPALCLGQESSLTLKPATPTKEVFTGDSFVITCLTSEPPSAEYKLKWLNPDGREVPSVPTAPVYVSGMKEQEKQDGLQIVFLRHNKKHSGVYKCIKVKTDTGSTAALVDFTVKIYKSIEFTGPSRMEVVEGESPSLPCTVKFDPDVTSASVVWDKTGQNIVNENSDKYKVSETRPPNARSYLSIVRVNRTDAGMYSCRATQFSPTMSQFKQHEISLMVNYRPEFTRKTLGGVWIDRHEIQERGKRVIDVKFTCEVEAEPQASIVWYDDKRRPVDMTTGTAGVLDISNKENLSVLTYRYNVSAKETAEAPSGSWPPAGTNYQEPARPAQVTPPNVQFTCRVTNSVGSDANTFNLKVGEMPLPPAMVEYSYNGTELTLVLRQPQVDPPVDFYRLEFKNGVNVDFNADAAAGPASDSREQESGDSSNTVASTYTIALDNVPSGNHQLVIYAHNPVGWSSVVKPAGARIHVVNRAASGVHSSLAIVLLSLLSALLLAASA